MVLVYPLLNQDRKPSLRNAHLIPVSEETEQPARAELITKSFRHMLSHPCADFAVLPDTLADAMLHALPYQRLRINVELPHILDIEDAAMFLQMAVDGGIFPFQEA